MSDEARHDTTEQAVMPRTLKCSYSSIHSELATAAVLSWWDGGC